MKLRRLSPVLSILLLLICNLPIDPLQDYEKSSIDFCYLSDSTTFFIGDTVHILLALKLPHLLDSITITIDTSDTVLWCDNTPRQIDTLALKRVFTTPDTMTLEVAAAKTNNSRISKTTTLIIRGKAPQIVHESKGLFQSKAGLACTLFVAATGTGPLVFQWFKDESAYEHDTLDTLQFPDLQPGNNGAYFCIVSNEWGSDTGSLSSIVVENQTGKAVFWKFGMLRDTVREGETLQVRIDSFYTIPAADSVTLSFVSSPDGFARFDGDSLFTFASNRRDSGNYSYPVVVTTPREADTAFISISVLPHYCTLALSSDSGTILVSPQLFNYRWGDTITVSAVPESGFVFKEWNGALSGNDPVQKVVIVDDFEIGAHFTHTSGSECSSVQSGKLMEAIIQASQSPPHPASLCPEPGFYEQGTLKLNGIIRFNFQ